MKLSEAPVFPPIRKGLRVKTPQGVGGVAYGRQNRLGLWEAASVVLDSRKVELDYRGTVFPAEQIEILEEW